MKPALFHCVPHATEVFPWIPLGAFPTRVHRIEGLAPSSVELWIKREDECSSAFGGNKVRKLEFALAAARARGARKVTTFGGYGSHHVAATAIHAPRCGLAVEAVLFPQPVDEHVRDLLLAEEAAGAKLTPVGSMLGVPSARLRAWMEPDTDWLAGGGSSVAGTLGYVSAGMEILAQVRAGELPLPDVVYVALGSGGTFAGLCWSLWAERPIELVGVDVAGRWSLAKRRARSLLQDLDRAMDQLHDAKRIGQPPRSKVEERAVGQYGVATDASQRAVRLARDRGLELDPIYTGKVMAALLADAAEGRLAGKHVLFVHTANTSDLAPLIERGPGTDALPPALREVFNRSS